jgi:hypothetical protein
MGAAHNAPAKLNLAAGYPVRFQEIKADGGAHNVNNGIKRAHFVERHIFNRRIVNLRFGFGYSRKNVQCAGFCAFGNVRARDEEAYIRPSPVNMMRVIMRARVIVSAVMMTMIVSVVAAILIIGDMARIAVKVNYGVESGYSASSLLDKIQFPAVKIEFGEFRFEIFGINAEINQSA